ncbi:MAG: MopE-related protein [Myxococcota bacterium]
MPVEICDDIDDDCDGQTDEGFAGLGSLCAAGVGACERTGTVRCAADGHATACAAVPGEGRAETCNGIDDDCDGETDEGFGVGEACVVGSGQCAVAGVVACAPGAGSGGGPDGATVCAQTARSCDDGDPCSDDSCDAVRGCTHAAIEGCCAGPGGACGAGESCVEGRCAALLCAPCDPAVGCPAPGSICLDYPGGAACATACAAAGDCPPGFDCTLFTNDGTSETTQVCVAAAETCTCEDTPAERCADDRLVRTGACGVIADVIGTCTRGCVDGVGCCPVGTTKSDGACVPDAAEPEPDRAPEASGAEVAEVSRGHADDGCASGGAGASGLLLGGLGVAALALSSRRRSRSSAPRAR